MDRKERLFYIIIACLFLFSLVFRLSFTFNRGLGADEFEHLHATWLVSQGEVPFKDFWENHPPLLYYLLAPLMQSLGPGIPAILVSRALCSALGLVILWLTYIISRWKNDIRVSLLAALVLSYMVIFWQRTVEVRPDQLMIIAWLLSLWICLKGYPGWGFLRLFLAGLLLGIGVLFSPKTLFPYASMMAALAAVSFLDKRDLRRTVAVLFSYSLGFVALLAVCLGLFYKAGMLTQFVQYTILDSFSYPDIFSPTYLLRPKNLSFFLLAFAGMWIPIRSMKSGFDDSAKRELLLLIPALVLLVVFVFFMRAPFTQSALLSAPLLAIYGGEALDRSLRMILESPSRKSVLCVLFTVSMALVLPLAGLYAAHPFAVTNSEQFNKIRFILKFTAADDPIFDGNAAYIFRPHAYVRFYLGEGVRWRMEHGEISERIKNELIANKCRVVMMDDRTAYLPDPVKAFLKDNYVSTPEPDIYVYGKELPPEKFKDRTASVRLFVASNYFIKAEGRDLKITVDGAPFAGALYLERGMHEIRYDGVLTGLRLQVMLEPSS